MRTEKVFVTPEMAKAWLAKNNVNNRHMRPSVVSRYAFDMKRGEWRLTHQGIAFRSDGTIADGQHRLAAVVMSGCGVWMLVTYGMDEPTVDLVKPRNPADVAAFAEESRWLTSSMVAIAAFMLRDMANVRGIEMPASRVIAYASKYRGVIIFGHDVSSCNAALYAAAGMRATYACAAFHGVSLERIARFAFVLRTGNVSGPDEWAAIRLREALLSSTASPWYGGSSRRQTVLKAQRALAAFVDGTALRQLKAPDYLIYPAPPEA